jgi:predicted MPP superfamily phosphohydrolase
LNPDIIVITGDLIDMRKFDLNKAMEFIKEAAKIAPIYYVSGNHEAWSGRYIEIKENLIKNNVYIIDDSADYIFRENSKIQIMGLKDPDFQTSSYIEGTKTEKLKFKIHELSQNDNFKILLSHRPELFDIYSKNNIDIIFSGHAHGGQFRIPFIGGLIAPDQGLFPKYTSGQYNDGNSSMFVSRGLGNSIIPVRIFNSPEIVFVTLKSVEK